MIYKLKSISAHFPRNFLLLFCLTNHCNYSGIVFNSLYKNTNNNYIEKRWKKTTQNKTCAVVVLGQRCTCVFVRSNQNRSAKRMWEIWKCNSATRTFTQHCQHTSTNAAVLSSNFNFLRLLHSLSRTSLSLSLSFLLCFRHISLAPVVFSNLSHFCASYTRRLCVWVCFTYSLSCCVHVWVYGCACVRASFNKTITE